MFAQLKQRIHNALSRDGGTSRRGTVLLLVLGTLAMVLVLSVVYAALGKGDRRQARAVVRRETTSQSVNAIGSYLARVIGDDATDVVPDVTDPILIPGATGPIMRRETTDIPMTDSFFRSVPSEVITGTGPDDVSLLSAMRFRPTGGHDAELSWNTNIQGLTGFSVDPRGANDPFLASTRPVDLGASGLDIQSPGYQRELDWLQISNFAPDGRFVNLFYLREQSDNGGFDTPSLDLTRAPGQTGTRASRLSLFNAAGNPTDFLPYGDILSGGSGGSVSRERADWNIPAHWTMDQRQMFRPVTDPTLETNPSSPDNWQYQYADADGDGIIDSRWMELVDASDPNNPRPILGDSEYRFFIAARAIDLSSLVNVSTATDFVAPPTSASRVGSGPQEVNLFSLLHMDQHRFAHASVAEANANGIGYNDVFATGSGQPGDYGTYDRAFSQQMGRKANLRLQSSILGGAVPDYGTVPGEQNPNANFSDNIADYTLLTDADERVAIENEVGSVYPGVSAGGNDRASPFGVDDLIELLTYHGVNDSDNFSSLEQAMVASNTNQNALSLSPLRSDRATALDIGLESTTVEKYKRSAVDIRRMLTTVSGHRPLRSSIVDQADIAFLDADRDLKIRLDDLVLDDGRYPNDADGDTVGDYQSETSELLANTFGVYLKTLAPYITDGGWDTTLGSSLQTEYYGGMGPELAVRLAAHSALNFRDMADAPFVDDNRNGIPDLPSVLDYDLSDTTQKALYAQRRDVPTAAVLKLSDAFDLASSPLMQEMWDAGLKLDVDEVLGANPGQLIAADGNSVSHEAMILYGVEAQPFLSEAASLTMYVDMPRQVGDPNNSDNLDEDPEHGEWTIDLSNPGGPDGAAGTADDFDGLPNIDGAVDASNQDFLFQVLMFQIFNPFDVPIVLDDFYIEYANSFYMFRDPSVSATPTVIQPRETIVVWASNPADEAEIDNRINAAYNALNARPPLLPSGASYIDMILKQQIGTKVRRVALSRFSSTSFGIRRVSGNAVVDMFYKDASNQSIANRVVLLWRDLPNITDPATGRFDLAVDTLQHADRATDLLVDRLRDTSRFNVKRLASSGSTFRGSLDRRLDLPTLAGPNGNAQVMHAIKGDATHRAAPDLLAPLTGWENYNFNRAVSFALWGNIRRNDDFAQDSGTSAVRYYDNSAGIGNTNPTGQIGKYDVEGTPVGALPAAIFEAATADPAQPSAILRNTSQVAGDGNVLYPEGLSLLDDIVSPQPEASDRLDTLVSGLISGSISLSGLAMVGEPVTNRFNLSAGLLPINSSALADVGDYEGKSYITVTMNQNEFRDIVSGERSFRVGDMLLPLAVGAYRTPMEPTSTGAAVGTYDTRNADTRIMQYEAQWTTLGEVLAAAMGYTDTVGPPAAAPGPEDPFTQLSFDSISTGVPTPKDETYVLDRGHLRLDAFVPFIDVNTASGFGVFDEGLDIRRGLGIPLALTLFDLAQAGSELDDEAYGGIDRPMMGLINANTAEPEVLRLVPGLSFDAGNTNDRLFWAQAFKSSLGMQAWKLNAFQAQTSGTTTGDADFADVGSTIAGYRGVLRQTRFFRPRRVGLPGGASLTEEVADALKVPVDGNRLELGLQLDRSASSGILGLRTRPGIESLGELFAARNVIDPAHMEHHMDGFARDDRTLGVAFVDLSGTPSGNQNFGLGVLEPRVPNELKDMAISTFGTPLTGDLLGLRNVPGIDTEFPGWAGVDGTPNTADDGPLLPIMPDQVPDDYAEQLAQLDAVSNSLSVGSDYYAVWFVVHGYKESDTVGLGDNDPLVPSFRGRYLMIVDRSNVVRRGDKPRILAFVQIPEKAPTQTAVTFRNAE